MDGERTVKMARVRPILSKVKKALFDIIGERIKGAYFLDLFAGTGTVGAEAAKRGAEKVIFVDKDMECIAMIKKRLSSFLTPCILYRKDAFIAIKAFYKKGEEFDIIFCAPPYSMKCAEKILRTLKEYPILKKGGILIIEHHKKEKIKELHTFSLMKKAEYGQTHLSFFYKEDKAL